jgi:hypothetical protein
MIILDIVVYESIFHIAEEKDPNVIFSDRPRSVVECERLSSFKPYRS